jgi:hypothetical protein
MMAFESLSWRRDRVNFHLLLLGLSSCGTYQEVEEIGSYTSVE